jgi:hypothetical protein
MKALAVAAVLGIILGGCASMSSYERQTYRELEDIGARCETVADPATAGILNVLPGFGDIYLAVGEGANSSSWGAFVLDLLLWPISVVWAVPQAVVTADEINKKECVGYYAHTEEGRIKYSRLKDSHRENVAERMGGPRKEPAETLAAPSIEASAVLPAESPAALSAEAPAAQ